jgi:mevalonate pyrophosphate decarboxylase
VRNIPVFIISRPARLISGSGRGSSQFGGFVLIAHEKQQLLRCGAAPVVTPSIRDGFTTQELDGKF